MDAAHIVPAEGFKIQSHASQIKARIGNLGPSLHVAEIPILISPRKHGQ